MGTQISVAPCIRCYTRASLGEASATRSDTGGGVGGNTHRAPSNVGVPITCIARICQIVCHTEAVRTTLELDDTLVASLMARLPGVSKTEAIQRAVRFYLTHDAVDQLRQVAGTMDIEDVSRHLRAADRTT